MKGYEHLASNIRRTGSPDISKADLDALAVETASGKLAVSRSIQAVTMLITRVMTLDACIDLLRSRSPFSGMDRAMDNMRRLCTELTAQCLEVYECCVADNVIAIQEDAEQKTDPLHDMAAEPPKPYGGNL